MSVYPAPIKHNGSQNAIFNRDDYIKTTSASGTGTTVAQNDARYLRNSGSVVSSATTIFNGTSTFNSLATFDSLNANLLKSKQTTDTLISSGFTASQTYSFINGMVYNLNSDATVMTTLSFTDIPITPQQSYIFTFILQPSAVNSGYYLKPNTSYVNVNGLSISLYGLQNVVLPAAYTYLVQSITLINRSTTTTPTFIALTSVSGF
jgi:hypothetical protein